MQVALMNELQTGFDEIADRARLDEELGPWLNNVI
jgi:hypothetical protein